MSGPEFWQTGYGRQFFQFELPEIRRALVSIATSLRERASRQEACLVCCPFEDMPAPLREFMAEVRAKYPADALRGLLHVDGVRQVCWNCAGRRVVEGPHADV
jgi:hypothetical protein